MRDVKFLVKLWNLKEKIPTLKKESKGFKFMYTDLEAIMDKVTPLLKEANMGFQHTTRVAEDKNVVSTIIFDLENPENFLNSELIIPEGVTLAGMNGYQSLGSALTYFRRYHLLTLLGIITDDDTDGLKPLKKPTKVDYVTKVKTLIASGKHDRAKMEKYFNTNRGLMDDDQRVVTKELISKMK